MAKKKKSNSLVIPAELNIKVTKKDIANGTPGDGENCPIGLAIQRLGLKYNELNVETEIAITYNVYGNEVTVYYNNAAIEDFITKFDATDADENAELPKPISFIARAAA